MEPREVYALVSLIIYMVLAVPLNILSWCLIRTSFKYAPKYIIFRSKGIVYLRLFIVYAIVEPIVGFIQILCLYISPQTTSMFRSIFAIFHLMILWSVVGACLGRQILLSRIFNTFRLKRTWVSENKWISLVPPIVLPITYVCISDVVHLVGTSQGNILLGEILPTYLAYSFAIGFLITYITVVSFNSRIPIKLYTDYYSNILSVASTMILALIWSLVAELFPQIERKQVTEGFGSIAICLVVHLSLNFLTLRPCVAIWTSNSTYLNNWEAYLKHYEPSSTQLSEHEIKNTVKPRSHSDSINL